MLLFLNSFNILFRLFRGARLSNLVPLILTWNTSVLLKCVGDFSILIGGVEYVRRQKLGLKCI